MQNRRRSILVGGFQTQFVITQLAWTGILLLGFAASVFGPAAYKLYTASEAQSVSAATAFLEFHARLWPALIALVAGMSAMTLVLSYRVAGPLVRFRLVFEAVARGELWVHAKIRRSDYPLAEGAALERMVESLRERIGTAQKAVDAAGAALSRVERRSAGDDVVVELRVAVTRAADSLASFQLAAPVVKPGDGLPPAALASTPTRVPETGFTLIELLIVVAVVCTLAAIALPAYGRVLDKARITRAIGDIRAIDRHIQSHRFHVGCYPSSLADADYGFLRDPWGRPYEYHVLASSPGGGGGGGGKGGKGGGGGASTSTCEACNGGCINRASARKDHNLVPINSDYDFFSIGADGQSASPLTANTSQDDIVRASDGGFIGLGADY